MGMGRLGVVLRSLQSKSDTRRRKLHVEKTSSVFEQTWVDLRFTLLILWPRCGAILCDFIKPGV